MQVLREHLKKEAESHFPYHRPLSAVFKHPRGRSGKPRLITKDEYYGTSINERPYSTRDFQNSPPDGGD